MNIFLGNKAVGFAFLAFAFYWIMVLITPLAPLVEVVNSLMLGVAVTITLTWFPAAWRAMRRGGGEGEWQLIMAIVLTWAVLAMQRVWIISVRWLEIPDGPFRQTVGGFMAYSLMVAGMLYIAAPGVTGGEVPTRNWVYILCAVAGGALVAGFVIGAVTTG